MYGIFPFSVPVCVLCVDDAARAMPLLHEHARRRAARAAAGELGADRRARVADEIAGDLDRQDQQHADAIDRLQVLPADVAGDARLGRGRGEQRGAARANVSERRDADHCTPGALDT